MRYNKNGKKLPPFKPEELKEDKGMETPPIRFFQLMADLTMLSVRTTVFLTMVLVPASAGYIVKICFSVWIGENAQGPSKGQTYYGEFSSKTIKYAKTESVRLFNGWVDLFRLKTSRKKYHDKW